MLRSMHPCIRRSPRCLVGPSGAKAASAGTFITLSANLAYMAPSTNTCGLAVRQACRHRAAYARRGRQGDERRYRHDAHVAQERLRMRWHGPFRQCRRAVLHGQEHSRPRLSMDSGQRGPSPHAGRRSDRDNDRRSGRRPHEGATVVTINEDSSSRSCTPSTTHIAFILLVIGVLALRSSSSIRRC